MNRTKLIFLSAAFLSPLALAGTYMDTAKVVAVDKVYQTHTIREPYQDCYIKEFYQPQGDGSATNEIMGGILGGLIGNQFGDGRGKDAMTVAGAALGASLAHDDELAKSKTGKVITKEVCETKYRTRSEERLNHYRIQYEYEGHTFTYTSRRKPQSDEIRVKVQVTPK